MQQIKYGDRIGTKFGVLVAVMLVVSITVVVIFCVAAFRNLTMEMPEEDCVSGTNTLSYALSQGLDKLVSGFRLRQEAGGDAYAVPG